MQFKSLAKGYNLYLLNKNNVSVETCPVVDITAPHFDPNYHTGQNNPLNMPKVCDVTINIGGKPTKFVIEENYEIVCNGDTIITPNKDCIFRELEAMKHTSEEAINKVDYHKERIDKCSMWMKEFSVEYKDKKEIEDRLLKVERGLDKIENIEAMLMKLTENRGE